jgi:serine O-acetyltransferase
MDPAIFLDRDGTLVPDDANAGIPARVVLNDQQRSREEQAASLGFSAYAVTRDDDPMSLAIQGLLDHSVEMDRRMLLILKELEALKSDQAAADTAAAWAGREASDKPR